MHIGFCLLARISFNKNRIGIGKVKNDPGTVTGYVLDPIRAAIIVIGGNIESFPGDRVHKIKMPCIIIIIKRRSVQPITTNAKGFVRG